MLQLAYHHISVFLKNDCNLIKEEINKNKENKLLTIILLISSLALLHFPGTPLWLWTWPQDSSEQRNVSKPDIYHFQGKIFRYIDVIWPSLP